MTDAEKLVKVATIIEGFILFNLVVIKIAENSGCKEFEEYTECVYRTVHDIVNIITEGEDNENSL